MTYINTDSESYNTGYEAYNQGEARTANPYPPESWAASNWTAGYDDAAK